MTNIPISLIQEKYDLVLDRIKNIHIKHFPGFPEPVFLISNTYPGVWLEHVYDAISWAMFDPAGVDVARAQVNLFLSNQKEDGQFPCYVIDESNPLEYFRESKIGYSQIQECVSFAALCLDAYTLSQDAELLQIAYEKCTKWDKWLCENRMTLKTGLIELFCVYDTGHDESARLSDVANQCPEQNARNCGPGSHMPLIAPDMNAVFYGSRIALAKMAKLLGKTDEADNWQQNAHDVKEKLIRHCYDTADEFFYDIDRSGNMRKHCSIHIANLFQEHLLDGDMAERIYNRYMKNTNEFWTPYPFPSMSVSDPGFAQTKDGNCWSFYSQGLTALRAMRWMDYYGKSEDLEHIMKQWVTAFINSPSMNFSQELHPITGCPSNSSEWYSSSMLLFIHSVRRLGLI